MMYSDYAGMSPLCQERLKKYPDIDPMDPRDHEDAQHQWVHTTPMQSVMQHCWECKSLRAAPLDHYPEHIKIFIVRDFIRTRLKLEMS